MLESMYDKVVAVVPLKFLQACGALVSAYIFGIILQNLLLNYVKPKTHSPTLVDILAKTAKNIVLVFGILSALTSAGINVQGLVAGLGLTGFALGFALKDTLANLIAGMFILLYRPFRIGQWIKVATSKTVYDEGRVKKIDLRYTMLETDDFFTLVPNSMLFTNSIMIYKSEPPKTTDIQ